MVIFQYNLYIFGIHLWTVLYPKPYYNEPCYKVVVVYIGKVNATDIAMSSRGNGPVQEYMCPTGQGYMCPTERFV